MLTICKRPPQERSFHPVSFPSVSWGPMDTEWSNSEEPHERLRWARLHAGFTSAASAARSLGMKDDTYSAYERAPGSSKSTGLDHQSAIRFARKFKVSWEWLLIGTGTPFSGAKTEAQERVVTLMDTASEEDQKRIADAVELLLKTGTAG